MDARLFSVIVAAIVATAGLTTAFFVLKPVTEDSDFSIIDQLEHDQVKSGLYYRYVEEADNGDGYKAQKTLVIEDTEVDDNGVITAKETETNVYENFVIEFGPDAFVSMFFDFVNFDPSSYPDVNCEKVVSPGLKTWTIGGESTDTYGLYVITYYYFGVVIAVDDDDNCVTFSGDIQINGMKPAPIGCSLLRTVKYDDMTYRLGLEDEETFALAMGTETYEGTDTFTKASQILNRFEKYEISYSDVDEIIFQTTEMYEGSECHKSIVNGTSHSGVVYENYVELYYGDNTVNVEGKRDGFEISAYSKLYYT